MTSLVDKLVPNDLWAIVEPLLPPPPRPPYAGRLDWSRASVDSASVRAKRGGTTLAQIPSIVASQGPSSTWSATAAGCR